mmetsp:Transcript_17068/g.24027  ORF Transcript_17068/g.24027 Transcript_17068/m.24027 type:complete len:340 (+) Transcript_17068:78-1097(+)
MKYSLAWWFTVSALQFCEARPTILQEQNLNYYHAFLQGMHVGFQSVLALAGYYEEEDVKKGLETESILVQEEDEEDQTSIQVIGLGLGRTGTTSLVMALEILGYTVVHDDEQTELTDLYAALEEELIEMDEFHEILGLRGYNATFKTADYDWVVKHPEVKAILTVRDTPDKYVDSWMVAAPFIEIVEAAPFRWLETVSELLPSLEAEYKSETTGGDPKSYLDRNVLRNNYVKYVQKVQDAIPSERLLTFNVKDGWGPLCEYLEIPEPEGIPFPHVHTRAKLDGEMFVLRMITWIWPLFAILPATILFAFARWVKRGPASNLIALVKSSKGGKASTKKTN